MAQVTHVRTQRVTTAILKNLYKQANIAGNPPPYFQLTDDVLLTDSTAIARHLIRDSRKSGALLGDDAFARAQIEQFIYMASSLVLPKVRTIEHAVYGTKIDPDAHTEAVKGLKEACKVFNSMLTGKVWLNGRALTFADVHLFTCLIPAFQLCLDAGFRKAMPALAQWFEKMSKLPIVVRRVGFIKPCAKAIQPMKKA